MLKIKSFQEFDSGWLLQGACKNRGDIFFPVLTDKWEDVWTNKSIEEAKTICNGCPVRLQCEDYAITGREDEGIWGGNLPEELRKKRMKRAKEFPRLMKAIDSVVDEIAHSYVVAGELLGAEG